MTKNAPPSRNQATDGTLMGVLNLFRAKFLQNTDDMLPAQVIAYDRTTNRAQVQPLILMVTTENEQVQRAQIASIPVLQLGGGGFAVSLPIKTGDLGWIKANDRDISLFKKNYTQSPPNTQRKHKFADAVFIPDSFMKDVVINSEDQENLVIQNLEGTVRIALWGDKVKITAPQIILDTPEILCTGNLSVDGNLDLDGNAVIMGEATISSIPFTTHKHGGVQTGGSQTGVPV